MYSCLQICDKEWHYYVINVEFPSVTLFVDGVTYEPYLVTDDWPIHPSEIDVQLTVGACWQGETMKQLLFWLSFEKRGSIKWISGITVIWTAQTQEMMNQHPPVLRCDQIVSDLREGVTKRYLNYWYDSVSTAAAFEYQERGNEFGPRLPWFLI